MKKIKLITISLLLVFLGTPNALAKEYKVNETTGKYVVDEAGCSYTYFQEGIMGYGDTTYGFTIVVKKDKLVDIASYGKYDAIGKYEEFSWFNSLKYSNFFTSSSKEFSCPKKVYVNYTPMPTGGTKAGYNLEAACDSESIGLQCKEATYVEGSGYKRYIEVDPKAEKPIIKIPYPVCSYKKDSTSVSSNYQVAASSELIYSKFSDNTQYFKDSTNEQYEIKSGSLDTCIDYLYVLISEDKKSYSIVNSCNFGTNGRCIRYIKEKIVNNVDHSINDDGTTSNPNAADPVDPTLIQTLDPVINLDFEDAKCETLLGYINNNNDPAYYLHLAFNLIKYAAIIMLFIFTIIEYAKAVASSNQDAIKKASQATVKRLIIAAIIFFLPLLIDFVLSVLGVISTDATCGIGG